MDWSGRTLDSRYRVEHLLGRGGMGSAFLAWDTKVGRRVVVKAPHEELLTNAEFRERFGREIRSLLDLEHPNVVRVIDVGDADGIPYVVLHHLGGGTLRDRMTRAGGTLSVREVVEWLLPIAQALDFLHGRGWLHRDVKPDNVLFDDAGHAFLSDFGIVKAAGAVSSSLTRTGPTPGSPKYMAPEAALELQLGPPYDQYALAVVAYECLAGRGPFNAESPVADAIAKASQEPISLRTVAPHVSIAVADAVMIALARDPARRHASCGALARALADATMRGLESGIETRIPRVTEAAAAHPEAARPEGSRSDPTPPRRPRNRMAAIVSSAAVVVVGTSAAFLLWSRGDPGSPSARTALGRGSAEAPSPEGPAPAPRAAPEPPAVPAPADPSPRPPAPMRPDPDRAASDAARDAFARAEAQVPADLLAAPRRAVETARAEALGATADALEGRHREAASRWTSAEGAIAAAMRLESQLRPVDAARAAAARDLEAVASGQGAPAWLRARRVAVDASAAALDHALAAGDVAAAQASLQSLREGIDGLRAVAAAAHDADDAGAHWDAVALRIPTLPYAKVRDGLEAAKRTATAAKTDLEANRFDAAASGLRGAAEAATPLIAQHEEALRAARQARASLSDTIPLPAAAPADAEAYASALARADAAIASGRFDDVAGEVAVASAARSRVATAVSAGRALADPARQAWEALAQSGLPSVWSDEVAAPARVALRGAEAAARDYARGAFADAARGFGEARQALAPLLDRDRRARASATAAEVAWKQVAERARKAHRLKAEREAAAGAAERDAAAGHFARAEAGWKAATAQVEVDLAAKMTPYRMDLSPGPGGVPVGWTADTIVRIGPDGTLQGLQERPSPVGTATSGPLDLFGDFRLSLTISAAGPGSGTITTALLGSEGATPVRAAFYLSGGSRSLGVTFGGVRTDLMLASGRVDFQVSIERRGTDVRVLVDGAYVNSMAVLAGATFKSVDLQFKMRRFRVRSLEISPL